MLRVKALIKFTRLTDLEVWFVYIPYSLIEHVPYLNLAFSYFSDWNEKRHFLKSVIYFAETIKELVDFANPFINEHFGGKNFDEYYSKLISAFRVNRYLCDDPGDSMTEWFCMYIKESWERKDVPVLDLKKFLFNYSGKVINYRNLKGLLTFEIIEKYNLASHLDENSDNVLVATAEDPELSIRLIKEFGLEYHLGKTRIDAFATLDFETIEKYRSLGLLKLTEYIPQTFFDIILGIEIEDICWRFRNDPSIFEEYPLLKKLREN